MTLLSTDAQGDGHVEGALLAPAALDRPGEPGAVGRAEQLQQRVERAGCRTPQRGQLVRPLEGAGAEIEGPADESRHVAGELEQSAVACARPGGLTRFAQVLGDDEGAHDVTIVVEERDEGDGKLADASGALDTIGPRPHPVAGDHVVDSGADATTLRGVDDVEHRPTQHLGAAVAGAAAQRQVAVDDHAIAVDHHHAVVLAVGEEAVEARGAQRAEGRMRRNRGKDALPLLVGERRHRPSWRSRLMVTAAPLGSVSSALSGWAGAR